MERNKQYEKNWSFVEYKNKLCVIYKWNPLIIAEIDYSNNKLNLLEDRGKISNLFIKAKGSTPGYKINNEIWFVIHKSQSFTNNNLEYFNYQDFFAVFDLDMNLIRYSELFKLGDYRIQFCTGLIVKESEVILSYSLMDTQSYISVYSMKTINTDLKWFKN